MKVYWYWPHPHRTASPLLLGARRPGDHFVVHALPSLSGEKFEPVSEYTVVRSLPDPTSIASSGLSRAVRPLRIAGQRSRTRWEVLHQGFDVAYLEMLFHHTDCLDLRRLRRRLPLVSHVHDVLPHSYRIPPQIERYMLRATYSSAGHLTVFHSVLGDMVSTEFGVPEERIHVIPIPFVSCADSQRSPSDGQRPTFLYFGRMRPNKGLGVLVDAIELLGQDFAGDVVIASGGEKRSAAAVRQRLKTYSHVHLELEEISPERKHELFSNASWLVLPYTSFYSQSAVLREAYSYRLPLIVSDVGAVGPTVRSDGTGFVVAPSDATALASAMDFATSTDQDRIRTQVDRAALDHDPATVGVRIREILDVAAEDWNS